jgi:hypothetical protein
VRIVLPAEGDGLAIEGDEPVIGDGYTVGIPGQILQQVIGAAERRFGVRQMCTINSASQVALAQSHPNSQNFGINILA